MLAKRYLNQGKETEEQFRERVKECVHLFQEAQVSNWNPLGFSCPGRSLSSIEIKAF